MKRMMIVSAVCMMLNGCDYTVPLVKTPDMPIDAEIVGLWQRSGGEGEIESLLVLPWSKQEYLVVFPAGSKNAMYARGCLWREDGIKLVQLDWFGTAEGKLPEDSRTFQYAAYSVESQKLTLQLLNPVVVAKDIDSSEALAKAIDANKDNAKLFREKMTFEKVIN